MADATASEIVRRVLADPPLVHDIEGAASVWSTNADVYEFMASRCPRGTRVLETGCGVSTLVFVLCGAHLTTVTYRSVEEQRFRAHCAERDIAIDDLQFHIGSSHDQLPALPRDEVDLVFVDGGHGFPTPIIDTVYAGRRLRSGGLLVLDDMQLPAVELLARVLDADPQWSREAATWKWAAWTRVGDGEPFASDFDEQLWLRPAVSGMISDAVERRFPAVTRRIRPTLRRVRLRLRPQPDAR
jgi:predicted O-methyltransferase YrrM